MNLFGIILYIVIIVIFISAKKAAGSGNDRSRSYNRPNLSENYSGQKSYSASKGATVTPNVSKQEKKIIPNVPEKRQNTTPNVPEKRQNTIPNVPEKRQNTTPNVPKKGQNTTPNVPKGGKIAIPNVPMKRRIERTSLEPHKEEQFQPRIRTNNLWGEDEHANQRIVALRLMEGDPVPEGYVRVECPYCAADNLVTKRCKQYHSCYFCRVPID